MCTRKNRLPILICLTGIMMPALAFGQDLSTEIKSLHSVLEQLYTDMIPLCSQLIGVARGIAGFAATWYIAARIWKHIANAEPVDFYPLFRPFVLGFAIMIFPSVIALINGVMQPAVTGTQSMVTNSDEAVSQLLAMKEAAIEKTIYWQMYAGSTGEGDRDKWYKYNYGDENEGWMESIGHDMSFAFAKYSYNFRNSIKQFLSEVLQILFEAASLCIDTIRTFYLIVLAVLGPLVFGIAVFDGFQHTLTVWIARYLNVFLWLPVANIFSAIIGKIQENMLKLDIQQINTAGDTFFSSADTAYLVFMLIGIVGYFTVPSVANCIIHAGGSNTILTKVTNMTMGMSRSIAASSAGAINTAGSMASDAYGDVRNIVTGGYQSEMGDYFKDKLKG